MVRLSEIEFHLVVLTLAWVGGFLPLLLGRRMTWVQCVGLAFVVYPFARMGVGVLRTFERLLTPTVLQPASEASLWLSVENQVWYNLVLPMVGLVLLHLPYADASTGPLRRERLADALADHGVAVRHSARRDLLRGMSLFGFIALAYVLAYGAANLSQALVPTGDDESQYWRNVTIPLIILLSASAGVAEEFLFRGVLLSALARRMPWIAAAFAQAVFFGFVHAGYGSWQHVLGPMAFGLGMAWVARHLGILPAMLLHAQVNVVFFTVDVAPDYLAANGVPGFAALLALPLALGGLCAHALVRTRGEAVLILWGSLRDGARGLARAARRRLRRGEEPAEAPDETRA